MVEEVQYAFCDAGVQLAVRQALSAECLPPEVAADLETDLSNLLDAESWARPLRSASTSKLISIFVDITGNKASGFEESISSPK